VTAAPGRPPANSAAESGAPSVGALCGRVAEAGTTRGPGKSDSSPRPNARRFSASFSLAFGIVLSTVTAFEVVINQVLSLKMLPLCSSVVKTLFLGAFVYR
jgi:hypothetical protein